MVTIEHIHSPLERAITVGSRKLYISIYRQPDTLWSLEFRDDAGRVLVSNYQFLSDQVALEVALMDAELDGVDLQRSTSYADLQEANHDHIQ